ncbi:hypothetical protein CXG81DRAFT_28676 [Caulochytrium protostelioides]|uniref:Uncharacterized protein n=1 Tax=Caulochytrium protostelioides TaxID=1555241 RepID=A0A4P9X114_9FUNG|nr:hypothetical protein CXG81DRAFT_28676 [Caulochytrium protostelioides]|eukprot:RKO98503.1 hypothetical protein CXG81DRAFT_28676 [Caulochytrium protostelioides]
MGGCCSLLTTATAGAQDLYHRLVSPRGDASERQRLLGADADARGDGAGYGDLERGDGGDGGDGHGDGHGDRNADRYGHGYGDRGGHDAAYDALLTPDAHRAGSHGDDDPDDPDGLLDEDDAWPGLRGPYAGGEGGRGGRGLSPRARAQRRTRLLLSRIVQRTAEALIDTSATRLLERMPLGGDSEMQSMSMNMGMNLGMGLGDHGEDATAGTASGTSALEDPASHPYYKRVLTACDAQLTQIARQARERQVAPRAPAGSGPPSGPCVHEPRLWPLKHQIQFVIPVEDVDV